MSVILPTLLGLLFLAAVGVDVFMTIFNPAEYGGPLTLRQNRLIWAVARRAACDRHGKRRHGALALAAPVMALATVVLWIMLLIAGFGLIYLPRMHTFLVSPGSLRSPVLEAFYFSASTATTLSIGDLVPNTALLRILVPLETLAGAGLLTAVLQYIMSISQRAQAVSTSALDIAVHLDGADAQGGIVSRIRRSGDLAAWANWCDRVSQALLDIWEAHTRYPILLYFHPPARAEALPVQLGRLLPLRRAVRGAIASDPLACEPGFGALCRTIELYLIAVDRHLLPHRGDATPRDEAQDAVEAAFLRLLRHSGYDAPERDAPAEPEGADTALDAAQSDSARAEPSPAGRPGAREA